MGLTIKAHFDGKVIVPHEPVDLPTGEELRLEVEPIAADSGDYSRLSVAERLRRHAEFSGRIPGVALPDDPLDWPVDLPLRVEIEPLVMDEETWGALSIEERLRRVQAVAGCIKGPAIPDEALRRENLYEERI